MAGLVRAVCQGGRFVESASTRQRVAIGGARLPFYPNLRVAVMETIIARCVSLTRVNVGGVVAVVLEHSAGKSARAVCVCVIARKLRVSTRPGFIFFLVFCCRA